MCLELIDEGSGLDGDLLEKHIASKPDFKNMSVILYQCGKDRLFNNWFGTSEGSHLEKKKGQS